jgi:hypothetical protein
MVPEEGIEPSRDYSQGILSPSISSIDHNSAHVSPYLPTQKLLIQSRFVILRFMAVDADNVDCCEKMGLLDDSYTNWRRRDTA